MRNKSDETCPFSGSAENPTSSPIVPKLKEIPRFYKQWKMLGDPADFIDSLVKEHGDFLFCPGVIDFYLLNNPELVAQVNKETHRNFDKQTKIYACFLHALGDSLVSSEGDHWKRQRKLLTPHFSPKVINQYFSAVASQVEKEIDSWGISGKTTIDFEKKMNWLTLEVSGVVFFSNSFSAHAKDVHKWVNVINKFSARPPLPIFGSPHFPSPLTFQTKKALEGFHQFIADLIQERRSTDQEHSDLFSVFLNLEDEDTGERMSDSEISDEVLGMIFGAHESTASAINWTFYELLKHPETLEQLIAEIDAIIGDAQITLDHLDQLPLLENILSEVLRLHPPFWFENRRVTQETELGGRTLKEGEIVAFSRYSLHRNPIYWENPNDFLPERFEGVDHRELSRSGQYMPFGLGPRVCMGRSFAMMELSLITISLLRQFKVELAEPNNGARSTHLTMQLKHSLQLTLSPLT